MPAMPEVAATLLRSFERDDLSLAELSALIGRDPVLAARVLRLANSARYSPSRSVATLAEASACLGLRTLRDLTLSSAFAGAFPDDCGLDRMAFWRASLANGCYAHCLAKALDAGPELAYLGGLMLRTGQLLMSLASPGAMAEVTRAAPGIDQRLAAERQVLGCGHTEVTSELARHWRFPPQLTAAFDAAAAPLHSRPFNRLAAVLRLANVVTEARDLGQEAGSALLSCQPELVHRMQLDLGWLAQHLPDHALAAAGADQLLH